MLQSINIEDFKFTQELINNCADNKDTIFFLKNENENVVIMSQSAYETLQEDLEIIKAELEYAQTGGIISAEEAFKNIKSKLQMPD